MMDTLTRFNRQVLQCQDEAYTLACYLSGDDTLAETLTQEAVIEAYRCYACQGGNCSDHGGRTENNGSHSVRRLILKQVLRQCHLAAACRMVPVTGVGAREDLEEVASLEIDRLMRLPEPERQALVLVTILGLSHAEAAALAGVPVDRLRRLLAQALRKVAARAEGAVYSGGRYEVG